MNKPLLIVNIIITVLLVIGLGVLITGCYLDNELLVHIGLFGALFVYSISLLIRTID